MTFSTHTVMECMTVEPFTGRVRLSVEVWCFVPRICCARRPFDRKFFKWRRFRLCSSTCVLGPLIMLADCSDVRSDQQNINAVLSRCSILRLLWLKLVQILRFLWSTGAEELQN